MSQELSLSEEYYKERIEEQPQKKFKASTGYISILPKKEDADASVYKKEASTVNSSPANISKM